MDKISFGNRLYELRLASALSQSELAARCGVTNKAVSKWETGAAVPKTETLCSLAVVLGVSVEELLQGRSTEKLTFESLSEKSQNHILNEKLESEESAKQRERKTYLILIAVSTVIFAAVTLLLSFSAKENAVVTIGIRRIEMITGFQKVIISAFFTYIDDAFITGVFIAVTIIMRAPTVVKIIAFIFFLPVLIVSQVVGIFVFIPYLVFNIIMLTGKKKNG